MSSPEASIEDILASIRKTFADEPEADGSKPVAAATDLVRSSGMPPFRSVAETPAGATSATPFPTPPRSRAAAIDDELEDLIDKPVAASAPAPQYSEPNLPEAPTAPANSAPSNAAISPVEAAREKWANLLNPHAQANGAASHTPQAQTPQPKADPAPQPMTPAPAPAPSGLFAPRKGGFYPPQDARPDPVLPMPTMPAAPMAIESMAAATPGFATAPAPAPLAPNIEPVAAAAPRTGFIPFPQTAAPPAAAPTMPAPQAPPTAPAQVAAPLADLPAASARALDDLVADLNNAAQAPAEPAPVLAVPAEPSAPVPAVASAPAPVSPAPVAAAAPPAPAPVSVPISPESSVPSAPYSAGRSFEDVVADMLRPLLEKWIDENMPRIVERALQRDAALGRKTGP